MDFFLFSSQGKSEKSLTPPNKINPNRELLFTVADILLLSQDFEKRGHSFVATIQGTQNSLPKPYSMTFFKKIKHRKSIKDKTLLSEKGGKLPPKLPPPLDPPLYRRLRVVIWPLTL